MSEENKTPLLEVKNLKKWFPAKSSPVFQGKGIYQGSRRRQLYLECRGNAGSSRRVWLW